MCNIQDLSETLTEICALPEVKRPGRMKTNQHRHARRIVNSIETMATIRRIVSFCALRSRN
jgi:hypothetical protein